MISHVNPRAGSVWQNKKNGNWYRVIGVGKFKSSDTWVPAVFYGHNGDIYGRPTELFLEKFEWRHD
jgi:hypothetical protein